MATIHDVAAWAGVSKSTVSRVLNGGSVSERARERVLQAIDELDYRPNAVARGLVQRRTQMIGVVVSDLVDGYYTEFLSGIEETLSEKGYDMMVCTMRWDADKELTQIQRLVERQVDGVLIVSGPDMDDDVHDRFQRVVGSNVPIVFIDRSTGGRGGHVVIIDNRDAARRATRHLVSLGHRRIAHIAGPPGTSWAEERRQGYIDALTECGIEPDDTLTVWGDFTKEGGLKAAEQLLNHPAKGERPTAIFAANDLMALGVMQFAASNNLRVPGDLAVVGFDDIALLSIADIPLTTVRQPRVHMGQKAARLMMAMIDDAPAQPISSPGADNVPEGRSIVKILPTELVVRSSCGSM